MSRYVRRSRFLATVLVTACFAMLVTAPMQSAGIPGDQQKYALLIGVSDYSDNCSYGDLNYCHKDALDMFDLLVEEYDWKPSNIIVLLNESATEENIINGIYWLKSQCASPHSIALFFFSGHGDFWSDRTAIPDGDEPLDQAIMPYDSNSDTREHLMFDDSLKEYLSGFRSDRTILLFDSCYSGGMIDEIGSDGRIILASADEHEMCWEGSEKGKKIQIENGVFTYCILNALQGAGDLNGDGRVSMEEAGEYAIAHVGDFTQQVHPELFDGVAGETFV